MNKIHVIALACGIIGILLLVYGILTQEIQTGIVFVFPFLIGTGMYAAIGIVALFAAFLLFSYGWMLTASSQIEENQDITTNKKWHTGGLILIGPIPIIWGSHWKITLLIVILAIILMSIIVGTMFVNGF